MRMTGAITTGVLIIEALLAGAFALGFYWLGGIQWGLLFVGILLLLLVLPWVGELKVVFDSAGPRGAVKVGWWGKVSFATGDTTTRVIIRVLGIPIRREIEKDVTETEEAVEETEVPPEFEPAAQEGHAEEGAPEPDDERRDVAQRKSIWRRIDSKTIESFCRVIGSGMGATCELIWGADEIRVLVENPAEQEIADYAIEQAFGRRQVGPADLSICAAEGSRRARGVYRIGLLRAALAGLQVVIDGRVLQFARQMKSRGASAQVEDEDQRIIEEIIEQDASREEGED